VAPQHPWPGVSHDGANFLAAITSITVNRAFGTSRLALAKRTAIETLKRIVLEFGALDAEPLLGVVVIGAI
jgi:hypothetical protein